MTALTMLMKEIEILPEESVTEALDFILSLKKKYMQMQIETFIDERDGQTYRTVKMPDGKIWMAQNLNYKTESGSWCYDDDDSNGSIYGRLYNWNTAKIASPKGWHLPSNQEWENLVKAVVKTAGTRKNAASKKFKSKNGWNGYHNGTDDFGFSALPGGNRHKNGFANIGDTGNWWTATEDGNDRAYKRNMGTIGIGGDNYVEAFCREKSYGFSVRCVRD